MIGTQDMATIAYTARPKRLPKGWKFLGEGCYRWAFLAPDGVVYKVQHYSEGDTLTENEQEYANFQKHADKIVQESMETCRLAPCYLWGDNVLAMEYVPVGERAMIESEYCDAFTDRALSLWKHFTRHDIFDACFSNIWFDSNGVLTMIDYAA